MYEKLWNLLDDASTAVWTTKIVVWVGMWVIRRSKSLWQSLGDRVSLIWPHTQREWTPATADLMKQKSTQYSGFEVAVLEYEGGEYEFRIRVPDGDGSKDTFAISELARRVEKGTTRFQVRAYLCEMLGNGYKFPHTAPTINVFNHNQVREAWDFALAAASNLASKEIRCRIAQIQQGLKAAKRDEVARNDADGDLRVAFVGMPTSYSTFKKRRNKSPMHPA